MRNISIDFITKDDISIRIDGEKLEDVSGFSLEIKKGEMPKYTVEKMLFQQQIETVKVEKSPQLRTIKEAVKELKEEDKNTTITEYAIRELVNQHKIPFSHKGKAKVVDLNVIKKYFSGEEIPKEKFKRRIEPIF